MHDVLFWLLYNPLAVMLVMIGLGIGNLWRKRHESKSRLWAVTIPFLVLCFISMPATSYWLWGLLEWQYPPLSARPSDIQAIVVLSASLAADQSAVSGFALDGSSRRRCERAIELYKIGEPIPIIVSGGRSSIDEPARATIMHDFMLANGVRATDVIIEDQSRNTFENARACQSILNERNLKKIVLVTDAIHLWRADRCFRRLGVATVGCGCNYRSRPGDYGAKSFVPHAKALQSIPSVGYEWMAIPWYWVQARI